MSNKSMGWGILRKWGSSPQLFNIGLYLFVTICPIFFMYGWDTNLVQKLFFAFGTFALFALSQLSNGIEKNNKYLGLLLACSLISVFLNSFSNTLSEPPYSSFITFSLACEGFLYVLCGCMLYKMVLNHADRFKIEYPIFIISILNLLLSSMQYAGFEILFKGVKQLSQMNVCGFMGTKSQLAVFSAIAIPILFRKHWILAIPAIVTLYLAHSYTAVVSLAIGLIAYSFIVDRRYSFYKTLFFAFILAMCAFLYVPWHKFFGIRPYTWAYTIQEIIKKPFIGWGFDNSLNFNQITVWTGGNIPELCYRHNDFLNIARDLGVPFLVLLIILIYTVMSKVKKDAIWLSIIILMICCSSQYSFYYPRIAVFGIVMLALKERELHESN